MLQQARNQFSPRVLRTFLRDRQSQLALGIFVGTFVYALRKARLETSVADAPEVYVSLADSWTNVTIRYLVHARQRRKWKSLLAERVMVELGQPAHAGRIIPVLPRHQVQFLGADGRPTDAPGRRA